MNIEKDQVYRHFKGNIYRIVTLCTHTETGEELVVYQDVYGNHAVYARPRAMFESPVDKDKYPDATQEMRFELMEADTGASKGLNPLVEAFLDADCAADRIDILRKLGENATADDIDIMAGIMDLDIDRDSSVSERFRRLMSALDIRDRFETNRLR